ncbi:MAG: cation transporter, partial [Syntrophaceae bacterium]|nr:cation transporter [Syntrophaceae bacterium]
ARLANRPPDDTHPYGHKRFETIATQIIAFILFLAGAQIIRSAAGAIYRGETTSPGVVMLVVAALSVVSKEILFRVTRNLSRKTNSPSLHANAWHHRSDALSSIAVLIGGAVSLIGWGHADHAAAIIVGLMILTVAARIFFQGLDELSEHAAAPETIQLIHQTLSASSDIEGWHELRTRKIGGDVFLDVHILVDPDLSVQQGHDISHRIEDEIRAKLSRPANILVHIEPSKTDDRNGRLKSP